MSQTIIHQPQLAYLGSRMRDRGLAVTFWPPTGLSSTPCAPKARGRCCSLDRRRLSPVSSALTVRAYREADGERPSRADLERFTRQGHSLLGVPRLMSLKTSNRAAAPTKATKIVAAKP